MNSRTRIRRVIEYQSFRPEYMKVISIDVDSAFVLLKAYLENDDKSYRYSLQGAFQWKDTPQGIQYWYEKSFDLSLFTLDDYCQIRYWINESKN